MTAARRHTTTRIHDPLRNFQFRIGVGTVPDVAGVRMVSGLSWSITPYEIFEGGNNVGRYAVPDRLTWEPITLENGIGLDDTLLRWASVVQRYQQTGALTPNQPVRRTVTIDVWNPLAMKAPDPRTDPRVFQRFLVKNAWISKFVALPELSAAGSEVAIQTIQLEHEGFVPSPT